MARQELQKTPLWQLRQLLIPNARDHGSDFEVEVKRLGILGLQFASIVAIVLPSAVIFFEAALVYFKEGDVTVGQLLKHNIENFAIVLVGITALFLSRTDIGQARPNLVAVACTTIAEMIATLSLLLQGSFTTYPPFVISLLIMTVVVPLRPITIALIGFLLVGFHYLIEALFTYAAIIPVETAKQITTVPVEFLVTITLVCMSLTAVIYRLRLNNFLSLEALKRSQKRLQRELAAAGNIQMHSLPRHNPVVPGFSIAGACVTATEVGGDYYDFVQLNPETLLTVIADVEGKGVASALVMANLQATLRALVAHLHSLERLVSSVNNTILADTRGGKFMTFFVAMLDQRNRSLHYINAGHVPPAVVKANGEINYLTEGGMVMGVFPDVPYDRGFVRLETGDIVVGCTDGITEAMDRQANEYGNDRLMEVVKRNAAKPAAQIVETVLDDVERYSRNGPHDDDRILFILKVL